MSKRRGDFVTLDELIGEIGVDATRWFMLSRSHDSTVDLDIDLAKQQSSENPVYYVQYAHARLARILRDARDGSGPAPRDSGPARGSGGVGPGPAAAARPPQAGGRGAPGAGQRAGPDRRRRPRRHVAAHRQWGRE